MMNNGNMPAMPQSGICDSEGNSYDSNDLGGGGLTKREQFAAMAMQGLVTHDRFCTEETNKMAEWAVECADALLSQLEKAR